MALLAMIACLVVTGCRDDSIAFHEYVPKTRGGDRQDQEPRFRMVTAIAEQSAWTWFFKLSGPIANLDEMHESWGQFLDSVRFQENGEPTWTLPENWSTSGLEDRPMPGGASMRIANIATGDNDVAVSVTSMPGGQQVLPNVNRWRGQLGLQPINEIQLATNLSRTKNDEVEFRIFDARGPQLTTRMGGAPFAKGGGAAE